MSQTVAVNEDHDDHLRRLYSILKQHAGKDNAITSSEIAQQVNPDDTGTNPVTRDEIKEVMRQFGIPVIGCNQGYYVPDDPEEVEEGLDNLRSRISGIQERKQLIEQNWPDWSRKHQANMQNLESNSDGDTGTAEAQLRQLGFGDAEINRVRDSDVLTIEDVLKHEREAGD
jgi:hypothetical protein